MAWVAVVSLLMATGTGVHAQERTGVHLEWQEHPSIVVGEALNVDLRSRFEIDLRGLSPAAGEGFDTFDLNHSRVGIQGRAFHLVHFEVERELKEERPWRDVLANVRVQRAIEVRGGQFKMPFSAEALTSATDLPFAFRSRAAAQVAPGRDVGIMVHGRLNGRRAAYAAGVFDGDGDNATPKKSQLPPHAETNVTGPVLAARATVNWLQRERKDSRRLSASIAVTTTSVREGLNSLRGETAFGSLFFPPVYTRGRRTRVGADLVWIRGAWWAQAEYMRAIEQRLGQGLGDVDLPNLVADGWYSSGGITLKRIGFAIRYDALSFGSASAGDEPQRNPRAVHVFANRDGVVTGAVSWFINRWVTLQTSTIRERLSDPERLQVPGHRLTWGAVWRVRFVI
jgi:hypothetical protein